MFMGILLLFDNAPAAYVQIGTKIKEGKHSYIEIERELLGCDHCQIGGILAEKWHFPSIYAYTIMHHHDEEIISGDLTYEQKLCYLVGIADRIAFEADIGIGESDKKCLQSLIESLDIENHTYEHAVDKSRFFKKTGKWR